jgi:hypothetical protein
MARLLGHLCDASIGTSSRKRKSNSRKAIENANENGDEKKPADLAVSGLNPIQGELEETESS